MRPSSRARGFTLVEIALGAAVGAVLMLGVLSLLRGGVKMFGATQEKQTSLQSATMISEILHRDLRYMVVPMVAPPAGKKDPPGGPGGPPGGPGGGPGGPGAPPPAAAAACEDAGLETLLPFKNWNGKRPCADEEVWIDLTEPAKKPAPGTYHPNHFTFYRTKIAKKSGGMFGIGGGGNEAGYTLQRVTYRAALSKRFGDQGLYVLRRDVEDVTVDGGGAGGDERVSPSFTEPKETDEGRLYKSFYFKRLVLSVHEAPEAGPKGGGKSATPKAAATPEDVFGGKDEVPLDTLYFARIMVAGASAGSGSRRVKEGKDGKPAKGGQKIDLVVNLIHLDSVSDRFRTRSLAQNWNMELPSSED